MCAAKVPPFTTNGHAVAFSHNDDYYVKEDGVYFKSEKMTYGFLVRCTWNML